MTEKYCPNCGHTGKPKPFTKGSIFIEIFLWLLMLLPGMIYSIWRLTTREHVCAVCGNPAVIPLDSPVAQKALADRDG